MTLDWTFDCMEFYQKAAKMPKRDLKVAIDRASHCGDVMKRKHLGSRFEDFLAGEGLLEECRASAIKFHIAREVKKAMNERKLSKAELAKRLKTSRTGIDRLLDPENTSITLNTIAKVANLPGKRIEFALR